MELYENRVINGLLKAEAVSDPEEAIGLLSRDIEIIVEPARSAEDDLWPAIWALATILERQFSGKIYINSGLAHPLRQPALLGPRCFFGPRPGPGSARVTVCLGCQPETPSSALYGDARGNTVSYNSLLESSDLATPISSFALAGYLGFATLATAAGIPPYRQEFSVSTISLESNCYDTLELPEDGIDLVGLGHLGQAYLALLFFLAPTIGRIPSVLLVDKGAFEDPNWSTQILIEKQNNNWIGTHKAEYLKKRLKSWGWSAESEVHEITWGWARPGWHSTTALLGLDTFEARRMAIAGGYTWIFDAGLGDSFLTPRISWHSIPPNAALARKLFPDSSSDVGKTRPANAFIEQLRNTPGQCGLLTYEGIQASAPSMGLLASALTWDEIIRHFSRGKEEIQGSATMWSPILPQLRTSIS